MWKTVDVRILLLVLSFFTSMKTTTLLSDQKKCGDPECETSIIRVQAIKDYIGPDCRYLSFKSGEEIMVYFKLSGKSEDLWAGSKGKDFGYFPMDAVQIEEVFVTEEVEVPTKETDFLCLDGGEYIFENKDSIFNTEDKENEYITLYTDEIHSKLNKPKDEAPEITDISFTKEYKELFLDSDESDSKSKDQHTLETTRHGNSELRNRMTEVDKNIQQEDQKSQSLKPVSEEATWSVSGIAGWLGLGGQPKEEPTREISETVEQITFRHRKIAITDDSDLKKLNDDSETEPKTWFPSTLTDLMHFGSSKAGFGLLYKENDPDAQDLSRITGDSDHRDSTTVSDTQEQEPSDSALSKSNWFDLDISDILTFGYSNENEVRKEKYEGGEATSKNKESLPPSVYSVGILMDQGLEKRTSESAVLHEEQEKHVQETTGIKKTDSKVQLANEVTGFKDATDTSVSTETGDKLLESLYTEHGSVSGSKVMENIDTKAIMKESERKNDQSGWYDSIYSSIFDFSKVKSGHDSVAIQRSQESVVGQLLPSHGADTGFLPKDISAAREENSDSSQTSQSVFSFMNTLNAQGFASKRKGNVYSSPSKKDDRVFHINKISKEQLVGNQQVAEKFSSNFDVPPSQENIQLSSLAIKNHKESRGKTQDSELVKDSTSHLWYAKSKLEHRMSNSQHKQITKDGKPNGHTSEIQDNSHLEDKNYTVILEGKQCFPLELENVGDSLTQQEYTSEIYSHEKIVPAIEEPDDGAAKQKTKEVDNTSLPATEIYLERLSKGEMTEIMQGKEGSNLEICRKLMFKELKEHTDNFPQLKDNPGEDEVFHDVSEDNKQVIQGSREQMLSASFEIIENTEVKEIARHSDSKRSPQKCNDVFSNDTADINKNLCQKEDGAVIFPSTQNSAIILSSLRSPQSRDAPHSREEKPSKFEEPHTFLSFNHYKHLLSFQSSTEEDKDYLQRSQEKISSSDELRNEEVEKKEQSYQKKYKLVSKKEGISNKVVLLTSLAKQNKTEDFIENTNLLKDRSPISSAEHPSENIIESSFNNQKLKDKSTEDSEVKQFPNNKPHLLESQHEPPTLKFSIQKLSQDYKITDEDPILDTQDFNEKEETQQIFVTKALEMKGHTLIIDYTEVMKREQVSGPETFLKSQLEKHIHYNIQADFVEDSNNENESPDLKSKGNVFDHAKDGFPTDSNDNDKLITSVVPHESINHFSQERIKEQGHLSQHVTEHSEGKQGNSMQDTEDELKKQTNKNHPNVLNNQEPSPGAMSEELFQRGKKVPGNDNCMWHGSLQTKDIHFPHMQIAGKHSEEEHISKPIQEHFDNTKISDALATAVEGRSVKEKLILSYPSSITFSSKMPVSLPYMKEDQKNLEVEQEVLSSHAQLSDCENSDILSQGPVEKNVCQMVHNTRKHFPQTQDLDVSELGVSTCHKQLNSIFNTEAQNTEHANYEYEQKIVYVKPSITPQLQAVKPQERVGYDNLVTTDCNTLVQKQPSVVESTTNKNPALHLESLEMQSPTFHTGHNNNPNKHLSHYMESMGESVDHPMHHAPLHSKHGSDTSHLVIDLNDETFARNRIIPLPKTLNYNKPFADSGSVRDSQEKSKKCTESDNEIALKNIERNNDMTGKEGVVGDIFTKTSWFLGRLFQNKHHEESKINEKSADYIVSQGQETEILGNDSEQDKGEVQNTKAISYSTDNFKIMEQGTQEEEIYKHSQEEYSPIDSRDDSRKDNIFLIEETASVVQQTVKNYKVISDREWDLKEANSLSGFQERYINLAQESKRTLQATKCGRDKLLLLQEFENLCHDTFSCEEALRERRQVITSAEYENKVMMTQHKNCLNKNMNLVAELRSLMLDIRNKCEAQKADSGTIHTGQLSDGTSTERNRLNSDKKLNSGHYSETNKIPPVNTEEKICTSEDSGQLNLKERVLLRNIMTQNSTFKYAEREWLFQIVLYLNDICDLMKSAFSYMMFMSRKKNPVAHYCYNQT